MNQNQKLRKNNRDLTNSYVPKFKKEKKEIRKKRIFLPVELEETKEFLINLMSCGAHFGHPNPYPTSSKFLIEKVNGCNIIDLNHTKNSLERCLNKIYNGVSDGGKILFINSGSFSDLFKKTAIETSQLYITNVRYRPGFFTNFKQILDQQKSSDRLERELNSDVNTKKEKRKIAKQIEKNDLYFEGIKNIKDMPKLVIVMGDSKEYETLKEETKKISTCFISLSDLNKEHLDSDNQISIPLNTKSKETIELVLRYISQAILEGYETYMKTHQSSLEDQEKMSNLPFKRRTREDVEKQILNNILPNEDLNTGNKEKIQTSSEESQSI